jgi:hypothetical protein
VLLWLAVPRAIDQVDEAIGGVPTSQQELNQKAKHSTGLKHQFFVGLQKRLNKLPSAGSVVHRTVSIGTKAVEALVGIFFVLATAAYWIFERERAMALVGSLLPRRHRRTARDTWELIDAKLGAYVRGTLVLVVFVATVLSLSFWAIGVPFWLLLGIFAGVVEIVPVIGPLIAGVAAVGVGLTESWQVALFAGIAVLVVRQFEDYFVIPRVMGHVTGLSPLGRPRWRGRRRPTLRRLLRADSDAVHRADRNPRRRDRPRQGPGRGGRAGSAVREGVAELTQALRQRPKMRPPRVKPRPKVPSAKAPIATALRQDDSRAQRPSASRSAALSGSPRRCLRSAPPALNPK